MQFQAPIELPQLQQLRWACSINEKTRLDGISMQITNETAQLVAVDRNPQLYKLFKNPSDAVRAAAIRKDPKLVSNMPALKGTVTRDSPIADQLQAVAQGTYTGQWYTDLVRFATRIGRAYSVFAAFGSPDAVPPVLQASIVRELPIAISLFKPQLPIVQLAAVRSDPSSAQYITNLCEKALFYFDVISVFYGVPPAFDAFAGFTGASADDRNRAYALFPPAALVDPKASAENRRTAVRTRPDIAVWFFQLSPDERTEAIQSCPDVISVMPNLTRDEAYRAIDINPSAVRHIANASVNIYQYALQQ